MAAALGYHAADPGRGPRLCFHLKPGSYDTTALIEILEQVKVFYAGEPVVLVWDGLSAHWSRSMFSRTSPTPPNAAFTASARTTNSPGPSSTTQD
ncbi:hypothetical protein [Streptomyces sirii]|uniref:hypothetical protein n=1 Tax=Streptomyces sirii TaxID=3127701 RepID=UPI003D361601